MASEPHRRVSVEEYLALERRSETKNEYLDGEIFAMTGASRRHNRIVLNLGIALDGQLKGRGCEVFTNDMRVHMPSAQVYTYPDVVVVCGEPKIEDADEDTLLNPKLIVEVLSPSTEGYDRGLKFSCYRSIPTLEEYLLIAQDRVHAEHFVRRQEETAWVFTERDQREDVLDLSSIGCKLALADVYDRAL